MTEPITYVGIDAHKRELHVAMLVGDASTPVTWDGTERTARDRSVAAEAGTSRARAGSSAAMRPGRVAMRYSGDCSGTGSAAK